MSLEETRKRFEILYEFIRYCSERIDPALTAHIVIANGNFIEEVESNRFHLKVTEKK